MRTALPTILSALALAGCLIPSATPEGRKCDADHACPDGLACGADGTCVQPCTDDRLGTACTVGKGECAASGAWVCTAQGVACGAKEGASSQEVCDGKDNDCNGTTDDAAGGCGCTESQTRPCGKAVGECRQGLETCQAGGAWGACEGGVAEKAEECNGKDDDCDGSTDEDLTAPACTKTGGACGYHQQACGGLSGWVDCSPADYGADFEQVESNCDGKDNDCNGTTDDVAGGCTCNQGDTRACGSAEGECEPGTQACDASGAYGPCTGGVGAVKEDCNGKDDDCDGKTDNNLVVPACAKAEGVCAGRTKACGGLSGWLECLAADYGPDYEVAETKCDGLDNDCDGLTDEALSAPVCAKTAGVCAGKKKTCGGTSGWLDCGTAEYGADYEQVETLCDGKDNDCNGTPDDVTGGCVCNQGDTRACGSSVGECRPGTQSCEASGTYGPCTGGQGAVAEDCNGKDDDCDGKTDNNLVIPACSKTDGVCAGRTKTCGGLSGWLDCVAADYGADYEAAETRCDGLDNDCDGLTDEALAAPGCSRTAGVCAGKKKTCAGTSGWIDCGPGDYGADFETVEARCDGLDNDCNGGTDDVAAAPACAKVAGVCAGKAKRCGGVGGWLDCTGADYGADYEAVEAACDGKDNDCDGLTDFALTAPACSKATGVCAGKTKTCGGSIGWVDCATSDYGADYEATETKCDGKDNDCNGSTDVALTAPACTKTAGVCAGKMKTCGGAIGWVDCTAGDYGADYEATETRCDGQDNDCNGTTDVGLAAPACSKTAGVCAGTKKTCGGAGGWVDCTVAAYGADYEATETKCDGQDNDCNGTTDVGLTAPACSKTLGVCAGTKKTCGGAGGWVDCTVAAYGADYEATETRCDGKDNDCNGTTDVGLTAPACDLTKGVCAGKKKSCGGASGWATCGAAEYGTDYQAAPETTCDAKDNDCDGYVDNAAGCVYTVAGSPPPGFADGSFANARFHRPSKVVTLANGDFLIADGVNHVIRRVSTATGTVSVEAGTTKVCGGVSGAVGTGQLCVPAGMAVASDGTVYIADHDNHMIRTLKNGTLGWLAGSGSRGNADGAAGSAAFMGPMDVALIGTNLFVADSENCLIRKVSTTSGTVSTAAGLNTGAAGSACGAAVDGGALTKAVFNFPSGLSVDTATSTLWIADSYNNKIRYLSGTTVGTLAGSTSGHSDGMGTAARFITPSGLYADTGGLYVADSEDHRIRLVTYAGAVTTVAGTGDIGAKDGPAITTALLGAPFGVTVLAGVPYFVGITDHRLRKLEGGQVTTVAGGAAVMKADGPGLTSTLYRPAGLAVDSATGTAYFTDELNNVVRSLATDGTVATVAGSGAIGAVNGTLTTATFAYPAGLRRRASDGVLVVAGGAGANIRLVNLAGNSVSTLTGTNNCDNPQINGALNVSSFCYPFDVALASNGDIYVADSGSHNIRKITAATSQVSTLAGSTSFVRGKVDATGTAARFGCPQGLALSADETKLYVADTCNSDIRLVTLSSGAVTTYVGKDYCDDVDGAIATAGICGPAGLVFSGTDLFLVSSWAARIKKISGGVVSTVAGGPWMRGITDGAPLSARFDDPTIIVAAPGGGFYVADKANNRIRRVMP